MALPQMEEPVAPLVDWLALRRGALQRHDPDGRRLGRPAGRPVGRGLCQRTVVEVNRLCLRRDFPPEMRYRGCSLGYRWAQREAQRRGFQRIVTYTLIQENGYSLRAARWKPEARVRGRSWNCPSRPRLDRAPAVDKIRWSPGPLQRTVVSVS